jgi:hypothetical protein
VSADADSEAVGPEPYTFGADVPLNPVPAGRTVLISGSSVAGARRLLLRLIAPADETEGAVVVETNGTGRQVLADCPTDVIETVGVVDCVSFQQGAGDLPDQVRGVSTPGDLTGIGMRVSALYELLHGSDVDRVRAGLNSLTTLLTYSDLRTVSRFTHTLTGRVAASDGFGALVIDPEAVDEQTVGTLTQFCDGRIDLREGDESPQLRAKGLVDQPTGWVDFP